MAVGNILSNIGDRISQGVKYLQDANTAYNVKNGYGNLKGSNISFDEYKVIMDRLTAREIISRK